MERLHLSAEIQQKSTTWLVAGQIAVEEEMSFKNSYTLYGRHSVKLTPTKRMGELAETMVYQPHSASSSSSRSSASSSSYMSNSSSSSSPSSSSSSSACCCGISSFVGGSNGFGSLREFGPRWLPQREWSALLIRSRSESDN